MSKQRLDERAPHPVLVRRLRNQRLTGAPFASAKDVVSWFGAIQAQDYAGAKWAIGQRLRAGDDESVDAAFQAGEFIRTHVLRPTWHFVMPADVRWLLALSAPAIKRKMAYYDQQYGLDEAAFRRTNRLLESALRDRTLTRDELAQVLSKAGFALKGPALAQVMLRAELDALICSGPRRGKQFTYALLEQRAPEARRLGRDEALAELAKRYFTSHGPALVQDFAWWSGLTISEATRGIELAKGALESELIADKRLWSAPAPRPRAVPSPQVLLLPNYDEYLIAFKDRSFFFDPERLSKLDRPENVFSNHIVVLDGRVIGGWRRTLDARSATVEGRVLQALRAEERAAFAAEAQRFAAFLGREAAVHQLRETRA